MPEARPEESGSGLAPAGDGWFAVNVRDAMWLTWDTRLELRLREPGVRVPATRHRTPPSAAGEPAGLYHSESQQEAFLVLFGECRLLVEGVKRLSRPWDFFHCPAGTEHVFVGASDGPCVIL